MWIEVHVVDHLPILVARRWRMFRVQTYPQEI
jgi:hypothetical protein